MDPWTDLNVIPGQVDGTLIKVLGTSESFNITWEPVINVNYGKVFYEVHLNDSSVMTTMIKIRIPFYIPKIQF